MDATALALAGKVSISVTPDVKELSNPAMVYVNNINYLGSDAYGYGTALLGDNMYILGGTVGTSRSNGIRKYNLKGNFSNTISTTLSYATQQPACVTVGTDVYVIGGSNVSGYVLYIQKFNTVTNTISTVYSGANVQGQNAVVYGTDIYFVLVGGSVMKYSTTSNTFTSVTTVPNNGGQTDLYAITIEGSNIYGIYQNGGTSVYNITNNSWITKTNIGSTLVGLPLFVTIGAKLYAYDYGKLYTYNISSNTWTTLTYSSSYSFNFYHVHGIVYNGDIWFMGGIDVTGSSDAIKKIAISEYAPIVTTTRRQNYISEVFNNKIYMAGGTETNGSSYVGTQRLEEFDPITKTTTQKANIPTGYLINQSGYTASSCATSDGIVIGYSYYQFSTAYYYLLMYNASTNTWTVSANLGQNRTLETLAFLNNKIYIICGRTISTDSDISSVVYFDYITQGSTLYGTSLSIGDGTRYKKAITYNNEVYVIGGTNNYTNFWSTAICKFSSTSVQVEYIQSLTAGRYATSACVIDNSLYVIGGSIQNSNSWPTTHVIEKINLSDFSKSNFGSPFAPQYLTGYSAGNSVLANGKIYNMTTCSLTPTGTSFVETFVPSYTSLSGISTLKGYLAST